MTEIPKCLPGAEFDSELMALLVGCSPAELADIDQAWMADPVLRLLRRVGYPDRLDATELPSPDE